MQNPRGRWLALAVVVVTALTSVRESDSGPLPTDDDPFQWLEEVQGEKALAWVKQQNAKTLAVLEALPEYKPIYARTLEILDSKEKIPTPELLGDMVYNFWKDEVHERGIWRRTTLASYRTASPKWETVLDVDALAKAEGKSWVFQSSACLPPAYTRCLIELSRGGSDAAVVREFDAEDERVRARRILPAGGQVERRLAGRGHGLGRHGLRRRLADDLRVSADREALEARHAPLRGEDDLRGRAGRRRRVRDQRDPERRPLRHRHALPADDLPPGSVPSPRRPPGQAGSAAGHRPARLFPRPVPASPCAATGLPSPAARPIARGRSWPYPSRRSSAGSRASRCSSSRARGCRSRTSSARRIESCSRRSTT